MIEDLLFGTGPIIPLVLLILVLVGGIVAYRLVWLRRAATESYLRSYNPQPPTEQRIVPDEKELPSLLKKRPATRRA